MLKTAEKMDLIEGSLPTNICSINTLLINIVSFCIFTKQFIQRRKFGHLTSFNPCYDFPRISIIKLDSLSHCLSGSDNFLTKKVPIRIVKISKLLFHLYSIRVRPLNFVNINHGDLCITTSLEVATSFTIWQPLRYVVGPSMRIKL